MSQKGKTKTIYEFFFFKKNQINELQGQHECHSIKNHKGVQQLLGMLLQMLIQLTASMYYYIRCVHCNRSLKSTELKVHVCGNSRIDKLQKSVESELSHTKSKQYNAHL